WEYACRAGATTSRSYGVSEELLRHYAWYLESAHGRAWPCGTLLPNDLGLFDALGNVYEWCQDQESGGYRPDEEGTIIEKANISESIKDLNDRILRSGAFTTVPERVRSPYRNGSRPSSRGESNYGFRPARSVP